jgi:Domain of unknown function (DUF4129)
VRSRGRLLGPVAALVCLAALASPAIAQGPITPEAYLDRLHSAEQLARLDGEAPTPQRIAEVRTALGLPVEIVVDGWSVAIAPDPVLEGLSGGESTDFQRAGERLTVLERQLTELLSRDAVSSDRVAEALRDAYRGVVQSRPDVAQIVLDAIRDVVQGLVQRIGTLLGGAGSALGWIALIAIVVVAVAAFVVPSRLVSDRRSKASPDGRGAARTVDWTARADEALRAGDLHAAVRALYLALLGVLASRGILADVPALTAGEARFAVRRARPALFPAIARATESYERVVYGGVPPADSDVQVLRDATAQARRP